MLHTKMFQISTSSHAQIVPRKGPSIKDFRSQGGRDFLV